MPVSAYRDGNSAAQNAPVFQDAAGNNIPAVSLDSTRATYRASASFVPVTASALQLFNIQGSASKTVRVKRILMGGSTATTIATAVCYLQRTSTAGITGTPVNPTVAKMDSGNTVAATAVVTHYTTAAQTVGTLVGGPLSFFTVLLPVTAVPTVTVSLNTMVFPEYGAPVGAALVLRGTADFICVVNSAPASFANAPVLQYMIEWEEDNS